MPLDTNRAGQRVRCKFGGELQHGLLSRPTLVPMTVFQLCAFRGAIRSWYVASVCTNMVANLVMHGASLSGVAEMVPILTVLTVTLRMAVWLQHDSASPASRAPHLTGNPDTPWQTLPVSIPLWEAEVGDKPEITLHLRGC